MDTCSPKRKIVSNCESEVPRKKEMRTFDEPIPFEFKKGTSSETEFIVPDDVEFRRSAPLTSNVEKVIPNQKVIDVFRETWSSVDAGSERSSTTEHSDSNMEDVTAEVRVAKYHERFVYDADVEDELTSLKITEPSVSKAEGIPAEIGNASGFDKTTSAADVKEHNLKARELSNVELAAPVREKYDLCTEETNLAKDLEGEYMEMYSSRYTEDLLFAVDVMNLVKHLNKQKYQPIMFPNSRGNLPTSPVDDEFEDAISVLWQELKDRTEECFKPCIRKNEMDYGSFQTVAQIMAASKAEGPYFNQAFLTVCVILAHCASLALQHGIERAPYFAVLVICSIIHNYRLTGEFPPWKEVIERAKRKSALSFVQSY